MPGTLLGKGSGIVSVLSLLRSVSPAGLYLPLCPSSGLTGHRTDLSVFGLRAAYAKGLCPTWEHGQQTWLAPGTRMVLFIENFHIEPALRRRLARKDSRVTFDQTLPPSSTCAAAAGADEALIVLHSWRRLTGACPPSRSGTAPALLPEDLGPPSAGSSSPRAASPGERRLQGRVRCSQLPFAALGLSDE